MKFVNTIRIDCPPADVFAFLTHFENLPRWNPAISQTQKITGGPVGVGSRFVQVRTAPTRSEETFEVTEYEPERRLSIRGTFGPFRAQLTYLLDRAGDATSLTNLVDLEPTGFLSLVASLGTPQIKRSVAANLRTLTQILERRYHLPDGGHGSTPEARDL